ncbi:cyclin-dependent kinases regulatory subunit 2 [Cheilinus undulatus]|uniref:cyclin-dependent kinases regulatory subunit 2 n=1 Tax=Cheilinus undulatus TaxID=241271 RepID=UPI001BD48468|nr:cyclin-dependent kinases regulatory subunit 2 [Cheilinus undulatus]
MTAAACRARQNCQLSRKPATFHFLKSSLDFGGNIYQQLKMSKKQIFYSDKYNDEEFEYRHVVLPKQLSKLVPSSHLMTEEEWRGLGVQQSQGWVHYMIHKPEPHILLFRRPLPKE